MEKIENLVIPEGVTSIRADAFHDIMDLESVEIPNSVTSIGEYAFHNCCNLRNVTIGNGVTSIGEHAFCNCDELTGIEIPDSVTTIGEGAFSGCSSLMSIEIPDGVTSIRYGTFSYCSRLTRVVIPDSVTSIGWSAFYECRRVQDVYYGGTAEQWSNMTDPPSAKYIHYSCTDYENHWEMVTVDATCEEEGCTYEGCSCGYKRNEDVLDAVGHSYDTVVTPPTCAKIGYTTHICSVCGDSYTDTPVPALDHSFELAGDQVVCTACGGEMHLSFAQDYALLRVGQVLTLDISPVNLADEIVWEIEGDEGTIMTDGSVITAASAGTAYVKATISEDGFEFSVRFRIDVTEVQIVGIQLDKTAVTTELYSTNYAGLEILLQLPQNNSLMALGEDAAPQEDLGIAIEGPVLKMLQWQNSSRFAFWMTEVPKSFPRTMRYRILPQWARSIPVGFGLWFRERNTQAKL